MLECRACVQRCIRAIAGDGVALQRQLVLTPHISNRPSHRRVATAARLREPQDALSTEVTRQNNVKRIPASNVPASNVPAVAPKKDTALRKEIQWLRDPVKFADHVHFTLRNNNSEKALELCRMASKSMNCVVAWNHVVNWHINNEKVNAAVDIYNEMKKRGQFPDSHTYMMLFRAAPARHSRDKEGYYAHLAHKAVAIYNSMSSPSSRVKPTIMHTNALLRLCSLARNMDLLWSVASQLLETGPGSADHITYATLISAIRYGAMGPGKGEMVYLEQIAKNRAQAVNEGRRIWQEVVPRWRKGEVMIDAELVAAMAKLLNTSTRMQDLDDVLSLVQQTTNITRLIPPVTSPHRKTDHVPALEDSEQGDVEENHAVEEDSEGWVPTPASNAFKPVQLPAKDEDESRRRHPHVYVEPSNGILNALIEACTKMRIPKTAWAYWELFTKEHNVVPDSTNYENLLRLLRINRSSRRVAQLMTEMANKGAIATPRTYRIAMSSCIRDKNNANVVENMTTIVEIMVKSLPFPDIATLHEYIDMAKLTGDRQAMASAAETVHSVINKVKSGLSSPVADQPYKDALLGFMGHASGFVESLAHDTEASEEDAKKWRSRQSEYDLLVSSYNSRRNSSKPTEEETEDFDQATRHKKHRTEVRQRARAKKARIERKEEQKKTKFLRRREG